jgi:hypothetical protein
MHFGTKSYFKSTRNHTAKLAKIVFQAINFYYFLARQRNPNYSTQDHSFKPISVVHLAQSPGYQVLTGSSIILD